MPGVVAIHEYEDIEEAAVKVETALARIEAGNVSSVKGAGAGVFEIRVHFGPGYGIYFGKDSGTSLILLAGGSKKTQPRGHTCGEAALEGFQEPAAKRRTIIILCPSPVTFPKLFENELIASRSSAEPC